MAIYHCSVKIISRSSGRSAVGSAAYRSGEKITNERDGITHDYTRKTGVIYSEVMLCENAPTEWQDRERLWNEVENIEKSNKAQVAREIEVALPKEFNKEEQIEVVRKYVKDNFVDKGMCADINIHDKGDGNPHAHIMLTMRSINEKGEWEAKQKKIYELDQDGNKIYDPKKKTYKCTTQKTNDWDNQENVMKWRESWAKECNEILREKGLDERIDHRSFKDQGIDKISSIHLGPTAHQIEQRGGQSERGNINREIKLSNEQIAKIEQDVFNLRAEKAILVITTRGEHFKEQEEQVEKSTSEPILTTEEQQKIASQMKIYEKQYSKLDDSQRMKTEQLKEVDNLHEKAEGELYKLKGYLQNIKDYKAQIKELEAQKDNLGFFKIGQKKEIERKIEEVNEYKDKEYRRASKCLDEEIHSTKKLKEYISEKENKSLELKFEKDNLNNELREIREIKEQIKENYSKLDQVLEEYKLDKSEVMKLVEDKEEGLVEKQQDSKEEVSPVKENTYKEHEQSVNELEKQSQNKPIKKSVDQMDRHEAFRIGKVNQKVDKLMKNKEMQKFFDYHRMSDKERREHCLEMVYDKNPKLQPEEYKAKVEQEKIQEQKEQAENKKGISQEKKARSNTNEPIKKKEEKRESLDIKIKKVHEEKIRSELTRPKIKTKSIDHER